MIKGINHQIIEVTDTGNTYYERALLIVKPQYTHIHSVLLEREAKKLLQDIGEPSCVKLRRNAGFWTLRLGAATLIGSAVTVFVQALFF